MIKSIQKIFTAIFAAMVMSVAAFAQGPRGSVINLSVIDAENGEAVAYATVSLFRAGETNAYKYALSNTLGNVAIPQVARGTYNLKIEMMGYKTFEKKGITVSDNIDLGKIKLRIDATQLDAAAVSAVGNPIIVKKDTIEYNASSFKTSDNDVLEDLLKKLPGVEVESDGSITANGQTIKKVLIDGKTFFLDDPTIASKNIPAKALEKVRVVERKSDQAQFTGIDDGEEEMVLDLSFRPGMMHGLFGNINAGGGHDLPKGGYNPADGWKKEGWRYQTSGFAGRFTDKSQISVVVNGNNTNNRGFNDMMSSAMSSMRGGGGMGGSRGMGGGMGGWGRSNGITDSWMGGVNGAFSLLDGKLDLATNYLYNYSDKEVEEIQDKTTFKQDGSQLQYHSEGLSSTFTHGNRFGVRADWKISDKTSILFEPQFNFGKGYYNEQDIYSTDNVSATGDVSGVNRGSSHSWGDTRNNSASGFMLFRQKIGEKKGRTISVMSRYSLSNSTLDGYIDNKVTTFDKGTHAEVDSLTNQYIDQDSRSTSLWTRATYTEPLGGDFFLEANYGYTWNQNFSQKNTYDLGSGAPVLNDIYSNNINNISHNHQAGGNVMYQKGRTRIQLGASYRPTHTINHTTQKGNETSYDYWTHNWSPNAMISYELGENSRIRMRYNGRSQQPSTSQLIPVPDNTDPLNISFGNPHLLPYFNHSARGSFGYTNKKNFSSVNVNFSGGFVQNGIVSAKWYDENGVQYTMPVNGDGKKNFQTDIMYNTPIAKSNFSFYSGTNFSYTNSISYIGNDNLVTSKYYNASTAEMDYDLFQADFMMQRDKMFDESNTNSITLHERIRFTYRSDKLEITAGGRARLNQSWYSLETVAPTKTWSNQLQGSINWTLPAGINVISDVRYNWYNGFTTPKESQVVLNAEITKLLFKKKMTLSLKGYDLLNQARNISVTDNENYHQETYNNTLGRYIIVSLTYRFGNFDNARNGRHGGEGGPGPGGFGGPYGGGYGGGYRR